MKKIFVLMLLSVFIMSCATTEPKKTCYPKVTILKGVNFENNRSKLKQESYPILDEDVSLLKSHLKMTITIVGHTDSLGDPAYNQKLSEDRASAVMQYFIQKGIAADRMKALGKGKSVPIADNKTDAGRAQNRRIEIQFTDPEPDVICK